MFARLIRSKLTTRALTINDLIVFDLDVVVLKLASLLVSRAHLSIVPNRTGRVSIEINH
jgi:hypothetical protein